MNDQTYLLLIPEFMRRWLKQIRIHVRLLDMPKQKSKIIITQEILRWEIFMTGRNTEECDSSDKLFFFFFFLIKRTSLVSAFIYSFILLVHVFNGLFVAATLLDWNSQFVGLLEHVYSGDGTCTKQYTCMRQSHHISFHYHFWIV